jgi:hypothetical protein
MMDDDQNISDEEKSFHEWLSNNIGYVNTYKGSIAVMKKLYLEGFAAGYVHRDKINAEIQLQK